MDTPFLENHKSGYLFPYKYWYGPPREAIGPQV